MGSLSDSYTGFGERMMNGMHSFGLSQRPLGVMVKRLLSINIALFVIEIFLNGGLLQPHVVGPLAKIFGLCGDDILHGMVWQFVTYMFLHGSFMHILMNMLGLFFLGSELEHALGSKRFLHLYLGCGVLGGLGWLLLGGGSGATCVGASGAVFGIIGAFAALFPDRKITLLVFFVLPVTTSARTLAIIIGVASLLMLRLGGGGVAHAAHLAGGLAGYLYGRQIAASVPRGRTGVSGWSVSNLRAWFRRRRYTVVPGTAVPIDWAQVDGILDKVRLQGINSLSASEKSLLDRASTTIRQ